MNKIGTLSEKSIHRTLKEFIENDKSKHEVAVGRFIADICYKDRKEIVEIQTKCFKNIIPKLEYYLRNGYTVKIVYPLILNKDIHWIDKESNEVVEVRKSSKKGKIQDIFRELYWIYRYIINEKVELEIYGLNAAETKYLDGYGASQKKRATKIDKEPTEIIGYTAIRNKEDFIKFIPETLRNKEFTSSEYKKVIKSNDKYLSSGLKILREIGIIQIVGKKGNSFVYKCIHN